MTDPPPTISTNLQNNKYMYIFFGLGDKLKFQSGSGFEGKYISELSKAWAPKKVGFFY